MNKRQYVQVALMTGRTYIGFVEDGFSPNLEEEICFTLFNVHFLFPKQDNKGSSQLVLLGINESPEGLIPQMDIMWHAVASIQYLREDSPLIKQMDDKEKSGRASSVKKRAELFVLEKGKHNK